MIFSLLQEDSVLSKYMKKKNGGHRTRSGEKIAILWRIMIGVIENPPFYQCARATARANDARNYAQ